jgi:hypothetical protein
MESLAHSGIFVSIGVAERTLQRHQVGIFGSYRGRGKRRLAGSLTEHLPWPQLSHRVVKQGIGHVLTDQLLVIMQA